VAESTSQRSFTTLLDDEDEFEYEDGEDVFDDFDEAEETVVDPSLLVENLGLRDETVMALKKRGINALFPIQGLVLRPAMEGQDLIGRAKTGSGKTLAFALPVVESLLAEDAGGSKSRRAGGRTPRSAPAALCAIRRIAFWICSAITAAAVGSAASSCTNCAAWVLLHAHLC